MSSQEKENRKNVASSKKKEILVNHQNPPMMGDPIITDMFLCVWVHSFLVRKIRSPLCVAQYMKFFANVITKCSPYTAPSRGPEQGKVSCSDNTTLFGDSF